MRFFRVNFCRFLLFILLACNATNGKSQNKYVLPQITPKSPDVAGFDRYGEIPVSPSTGLINVSIPLYSINVGGLEMPITLAYHNNGLKTDEIPSAVGLGWNLMAGGSISYQQKGNNDFAPTYGLQPGLINKYLSGTMSNSEKFYFLLGAVNSDLVDTQYDLYNLNFLGYNYTFYFDSGMQVHTTQKSDLKIVKTDSGFRVSDVSGNDFYFEKAEAATMYDAGTIELRPSFGSTSAFYLSRILTVSGRQIRFTYKRFNLQYNKPYLSVDQYSTRASVCPLGGLNFGETYTFQEYLLQDSIIFDHGYILFDTSTQYRNDILTINSNATVPSTCGFRVFDSKSQLIKKIVFSQGYFGGNARLKLNSVSELSTDNQMGKKWLFKYYEENLTFPAFFSKDKDHWGYYNGKSNSNLIAAADYTELIPNYQELLGGVYANRTSDFNVSKAGLLESVQYPTGGYSHFEYEANQLSLDKWSDITNQSPFLQIPAGATTTQSISSGNTNVGLITGYDTRTITDTFIIPEKSKYQVQIFQNLDPTHFFDPIVNFTGPSAAAIMAVLNMNATGSSSGALKDNVTLEPGTYTCSITSGVWYNENSHFYTPLNVNYSISKYIPVIPEGGIKYTIGGGRVSRITTMENGNDSAIVKRYVYDDYWKDVVFRNIPNYITVTGIGVNFTGALGCKSCGTKYTMSSESTAPFAGGDIEYLQVRELRGDNGENGKIETTYIPSVNEGGNRAQPYTAPINTSWRAGNVLSEKVYKRFTDSEIYHLIKETNYAYHIGQKEFVTNGFNAQFSTYCTTLMESTVSFATGLSTYFSELFYRSGVEEKDYFDGGCIAKKGETTVGAAHTMPILQQRDDSKLQNIKTKTTFSFDYSATGAVSDAAKGIQLLNSKHVLVPIEEIYIQNTSGVDYVVGARLTVYKKDKPVIDSVYGLKLESKLPLSDFTQSYVDAAGNLIRDSHYESRAVFTRYDGYNNPVEFSKAADVKEIYLWGYDGYFPVAKITGVNYAAVSLYVDQNILDHPISDQQLRDAINDIRVHWPTAMVTSYTYTPLVGLTSETDVNNRTTYYEYDGLGRLKLIKDQDGNILKTYEYHYKSN